MQFPGRFRFVAAVFLSIGIVGGVTYYLLGVDNAPSTTLMLMPPRKAGGGEEKKIEGAKIEAPSLPAEPAPPPPPQLDVVDSYAAADTYSLDDWSVTPGTYGFIDSVSIGGANPAPLKSRALTNDDVLLVIGWAGHQKLGMSMTNVFFALCDRIVGSVVVGEPRPDVAKAVHPYLDQSGWRGTLAVAQLPRCKKPKLAAFALAPQGRNLWPLAQYVPLVLPPADKVAAKRFASRTIPMGPDDIPVPTPSNITIRASALRVRTCGGRKCAVVGKVTKGAYLGYVVERRNGWVLIELPTVSGWLSEKYLVLAD